MEKNSPKKNHAGKEEANFNITLRKYISGGKHKSRKGHLLSKHSSVREKGGEGGKRGGRTETKKKKGLVRCRKHGPQ